jgi:hypothetical protein
MDRIIDVAALDRIVVNVVEFLSSARPKVPYLRGLKPSVQAIDQLKRDQKGPIRCLPDRPSTIVGPREEETFGRRNGMVRRPMP